MPNLLNIFQFLEKKRGYRAPLLWKLLHHPETIGKEDLNFKGDLDLEGWKGTFLPPGLKVEGSLFLYDSKIKSLPVGLEVRGVLYLNIQIASLPKDLKAGELVIPWESSLTLKYTKEQIKQMCPGIKHVDLDTDDSY